MTVHKVTYRTEIRGTMHTRAVHVAELVDHKGRVVAVAACVSQDAAKERLRINVATMQQDQLEALDAM